MTGRCWPRQGDRSAGHLWDVATGRRLLEFDTGDYTTALAFNADGTRLASSHWYPFERVLALRPGTRIFARSIWVAGFVIFEASPARW